MTQSNLHVFNSPLMSWVHNYAPGGLTPACLPRRLRMLVLSVQGHSLFLLYLAGP